MPDLPPPMRRPGSRATGPASGAPSPYADWDTPDTTESPTISLGEPATGRSTPTTSLRPIAPARRFGPPKASPGAAGSRPKTTARGGSVAARPSATARTPAAVGDATRSDRLVILSMITCFLLMTAVIMWVRVGAGVRVDSSERAVSTALSRAYLAQRDYRILHGRFGSIAELQGRGFRLSPTQTVVDANATASHWYLALRDTVTGVVCSRTGELFDESDRERPPSCQRPNSPPGTFTGR